MTDDTWEFTTEPAPDPHALCCRQCAKNREELARLKDVLRDIADPENDASELRRMARALLAEAEDGANWRNEPDHGPVTEDGAA